MIRTIVLASVVFLVTVVGLYYFNNDEPKTETIVLSQDSDPATVRAYWKQEILQNDSKTVYESFKQVYKDDPNGAHAQAHTFGGLLYEILGMKGFTTCDSNFGYGCFHEFVTFAVVDRGIIAIPELGEMCINTPNDSDTFSCFHGIGHGLNQFNGNEKLIDSLTQCGTLSDTTLSGSAEACESGVFMDYYVPISGEVKPANEDTLYTPCDEANLPVRFKNPCYFGLPHWWFMLETIPVRQVGVLCSESPEQHRDQCYAGMGIDLPGRVGYNQQKIIQECQALPDEDGTKSCLRVSADTLKSLGFEHCIVQKQFGSGLEDCV